MTDTGEGPERDGFDVRISRPSRFTLNQSPADFNNFAALIAVNMSAIDIM